MDRAKQIDEMIYAVRNAGQSIIEICDSIPPGATECPKEMKELRSMAFGISQEVKNAENFNRAEDKWLTPPEEKEYPFDEEIREFLRRIRRGKGNENE